VSTCANAVAHSRARERRRNVFFRAVKIYTAKIQKKPNCEVK
jgi:hypothetical protein